MRYKITLEYDGTGLIGWQRQKDKLSIQEILEGAIFRFSQEEVQAYAAGRTDAGVHARGQVVHFDMEKEFPLYKIQEGINFHLKPANISVLNIAVVTSEFNARFSAKKRHYQYKIINRGAPLALDKKVAWRVGKPLDIEAMEKGASFLIGKHNFTSFRATACQAKSPLKTIDSIEIIRDGENIFINISARSFLHHMVRNIVGTLNLVGNGKWTPEDIKTILEAKNRRAAGPTAPAQGLYFMKVEYL